MPELPEVETTRRGLLPAMKGKHITKVVLRRADLRVPIPHGFVKNVAGHKVLDIRRRAKYLLIDLDSGDVVLLHLGMSGSLRTVNPQNYAPRAHDHVIFYLEGGGCVVFHDPRRFGLIDLITKGKEDRCQWLQHLGPEPLSAAFNARYLVKALASRKGPIKPVLMDQQLVVGVGNIYASESLFLAEVDPRMPANKAMTHADALVKSIKKTLKSALAAGGSSLRDYVGADGEHGYFQHRFNVYDRAGEKCFRCKTTIATMTQSGRATYACPSCQAQRGVRRKH